MYADYTRFSEDVEGLKKEVDAVEAEIVRCPENTVRFLVDVRETAGIPEITLFEDVDTALDWLAES